MELRCAPPAILEIEFNDEGVVMQARRKLCAISRGWEGFAPLAPLPLAALIIGGPLLLMVP